MYKRVYFIGIGGIGMSSIARYFNARGVEVFGYDKTETELTKQLVAENIQIHYEDRPELLPEDIDLVVVTPAVPKDLKEYQHVISKNLNIQKRSQVLGQITSESKNIAVAGTHGKTTTSVILAHLLYDAGMEITGFLGGISINYQSNYIDSGNDWIVEEADEFDRSFLTLNPDIAIIGSLDADHLDIYGSKENMLNNYLDFAKKIKKDGLLLLSDTIDDIDYVFLTSQLKDIKIEVFGFGDCDVHLSNTFTENTLTHFDYQYKETRIEKLSIRMPGKHNLRNTAASIRVAMELGISEVQIKKSLQNFKGIKRRFEWIYETEQNVLIDDYAHHPEELRAAIAAGRDCYPSRKITGIFQPHLYSRTRDFMDEFAEVLAELDQIILLEIYPARELPMAGISSEVLFEKINHQQKWICKKSELCNLLRIMKMDVVMTLGAGDIDAIMSDIVQAVFHLDDVKLYSYSNK